MKRSNSQNLTMLLLVALMVMFAFSSVQDTQKKDLPDYSEIKNYFYTQQVEYFTLKNNDLVLTLRGVDGTTSRAAFKLASGSLFYSDLHDLIEEQTAAGILTGYDLVPEIGRAHV